MWITFFLALNFLEKASKHGEFPTSTNRIKIVYIGKFPVFALFTLEKHGKFPTFRMLKLGKIPTFTKKRSLSSSAATADLLINLLGSSSRSLTRDFPEFFRNNAYFVGRIFIRRPRMSLRARQSLARQSLFAAPAPARRKKGSSSLPFMPFLCSCVGGFYPIPNFGGA